MKATIAEANIGSSAERHTKQIASFDVFDTVLTRAVGSPQAVFLLLGRKLANLWLIQCTPEAFTRARIDAERRAYRNAGEANPRVTLRQIYAELRTALGLTEQQCHQLMVLESALEEELIRPVPGARNRVQAARAGCQRVVFLSDMYLPTEFIRQQLVHHGLCEDGDACYVSGDHAKSKWSGELFREVIQHEAVSAKSVTHNGNDPRGDVLAAHRVGLRVEPFYDANLSRYEEILESHAWATEGLSSVMAGAARMARLAVSASSPRQEALRDIAASVVAPVLVGYVLWVLNRAQQLGLQRLYFISRDGQILLEIARRLAGKLNIGCELRYLYGSRRSWLLPAITSIDDAQLSLLRDFSVAASVRKILARVEIKPEEVSESLRSIGLDEPSWSRKLAPGELQSVQAILQRDQSLHQLILQRATERRPLMIRYLKQEGLLDPLAWGLVDVGWHGRLQDALGRVLAGEGRTAPIGFYFGLRNDDLTNTGLGEQEVYFFDERRDIGFVNLLRHNGVLILLEVFCSGDHGQVVGFEERNKKVCPILTEDVNHELLDRGLSLIRDTVYSFAENLLLDSSLVNLRADLRPATAEVLNAFWSSPSVSEANALADFPCEVGLSEDTSRVRLAEGYRWRHVLKSFLASREQHDGWIMWPEGARVLTPPHIRFGLRHAIRVSRVFKRLLGPMRRVIRMFLNTPIKPSPELPS